MSYGFSFFEILVSEITMILASIVFVVGVGSLILFRKRLSVPLILLLTFISSEEGFVIDLRKIITWIAGISIVIALIFEDYLNGYFARKRMLKGTEKAIAVFDPERTDAFVSETEVGKSEFVYDKVALAAETERYFVFVFSENHAQVYDKNSLSGGTVNEFRDFLCKVINKEIVPVR